MTSYRPPVLPLLDAGKVTVNAIAGAVGRLGQRENHLDEVVATRLCGWLIRGV